MGIQGLNGNCYLLCAAGYAETSVQQAALWLTQAGLKPIFLGLKSGSIPGAAGGAVPAEVLISLLIGEGAIRPLPDGLLLAGGAACGRQFLTDPRVHLLVQQMQQASRCVGFLHPISYPLVDLLHRQAGERPFLRQEGRTIGEFMNSFVQQLDHAGVNGMNLPTG